MCFRMAHSKDLRARVCAYVRGGGSKTEAAKIFSVGRSQVYAWLRLGDQLTAKKPGPRGPHKLDHDALRKAVEMRPDSRLQEIAVQFGVVPSAVHYGLKRLSITHKKNLAIRRKPKA
jgi:transposase